MSESQISTDNTDFTDFLFTVFSSKNSSSLKAKIQSLKYPDSDNLRQSVIQKLNQIAFLFR
jgi:hypothetical protein